MNKRSSYTGTYANFAQKITIPNSAPKMRDAEVLRAAEETRASFYKDTFEVIKNIDLKAKKDQ